MKKYWNEMDQSLFTIKNIGTFAVEMFKIKYNIFPDIITTLDNKMTFFTFHTNIIS